MKINVCKLFEKEDSTWCAAQERHELSHLIFFKERLENRKQISLVMAGISKFLDGMLSENILVRLGKDIHICKLEKHGCEVAHRTVSRCWVEYVDPLSVHRKRKDSWNLYEVLLEGPHLSFRWDEEFEIYLPQSREQGIVFTVATEDLTGEVEDFRSDIFFADGEDILSYLRLSAMHAAYVEDIVVPFLAGKHTECCIGEHTQGLVDYPFDEITELAGEHGSFFYAGSESEAYLWGVVRQPDGSIDFGGAHPASTHPVLFFSNGYLNGVPVNPRRRVDSTDVVALGDNHHFIFPSGGRTQGCQHSMFGQKYSVLTARLEEAAAHFASTPFARYYDPHIVERYYEHLKA